MRGLRQAVKLVFLTQRLDGHDAVLGFVPRWVRGLAKHCERVRVIALDANPREALPDNADVRVVGRRGRIRRFLRYRRFLREALVKDRFDAVLAHMVPRYALLAAGPARRAGARQYLWYTHGTVDARLRRATAAVDLVFTASEESLRLATAKRVVTGHGIDLVHFGLATEEPGPPARLLFVGRVSPRKDPEILVRAIALLAARGRDVALDLVGDALAPGDASYVHALREEISARGLQERVRWHGEIPYNLVPARYRDCTICVHPSRTGSIDKVVLEAMATGRLPLTCDDAFEPVLKELGPDARVLRFAAGDPEDLARCIEAVLDLGTLERTRLGRRLRAIVERDHEVDALMQRLVRHMEA